MFVHTPAHELKVGDVIRMSESAWMDCKVIDITDGLIRLRRPYLSRNNNTQHSEVGIEDFTIYQGSAKTYKVVKS